MLIVLNQVSFLNNLPLINDHPNTKQSSLAASSMTYSSIFSWRTEYTLKTLDLCKQQETDRQSDRRKDILPTDI